MLPAKIPMGEMLKQHAAAATAKVGADSDPSYAPQCHSQGEWVNAVMSVAPLLDPQGLQKALGILDCAISNIHQMKALDNVIASACESDQSDTAAEVLRSQVLEQQQMLLHQLHCLGADHVPPGWEAPLFIPASQRRSLAASGSGFAACDGMGPFPGHSPMRPLLERRDIDLPPCEGRRLDVQADPAWFAAAGGGHRVGFVAGLGGGASRQSSAKEVLKSLGERPRGQGREVQTLSSSLQVLANEDPDCLFIVRRINKLGFKACRKLKQHFSTYGPVIKVLVAHSTVRQTGDPQCSARRRPSSLGFVHMANAAAVQQVLDCGAEQEVDGSMIRVQRFERHQSEDFCEEFEAEDDQRALAKKKTATASKAVDFDRQQSAFSTVSTRTASSAATSSASDSIAPESSSNDQD